MRAVSKFFEWCQVDGLELGQIEPLRIPDYVEMPSDELSASRVKQHLAVVGARESFRTTELCDRTESQLNQI